MVLGTRAPLKNPPISSITHHSGEHLWVCWICKGGLNLPSPPDAAPAASAIIHPLYTLFFMIIMSNHKLKKYSVQLTLTLLS